MQQVIFAVVGYLILLFAWGTICLLTYAVSIAVKSKKPIQTLSGLSQVVTYIINTLFGLYLLYIGFQLLIHGQILWLVIYIFIGWSLAAMLFNWIVIPFAAIPILLGEHSAKQSTEAEIVTAEVLDEAKKVIDISEGDKTVNRRLAIYFLIDYAVGLFYIIWHPNQYHMIAWWDYVVTPIFFMFQSIVWIGIVLLIYNKIKHHKFFYKNKREWLTRVFQIDILIVVAIQAIAIVIVALFVAFR